MWLVGRIAEQVPEEYAHRPPQIDADRAGQQADFPDHRHRNVHDRVSALCGGEHCLGLWTEDASAGRMEDQGVRIGDGRRVSHGAAWMFFAGTSTQQTFLWR